MADDTQPRRKLPWRQEPQPVADDPGPLGSDRMPEFDPGDRLNDEGAADDQDRSSIDLDLPRLVSDYSGLLYRYAFRLTGRQADAEDLTQQTFLIAHQKLHQVRNAAAARSWLFAVMRHVYLRVARKAQVERLATTCLNVDSLPEVVDDELAIDREWIQGAIDELPDTYKLVLLSYYFENLSYREIAERFELPVGTVMSRLSRAKDHLRQKLLPGSDQQQQRRPTALGAMAIANSGKSRIERAATFEDARREF